MNPTRTHSKEANVRGVPGSGLGDEGWGRGPGPSTDAPRLGLGLLGEGARWTWGRRGLGT